MTLIELRVRQLGVIEDLTLRLGAGMTALTGETGAGKTLVVEAIHIFEDQSAMGVNRESFRLFRKSLVLRVRAADSHSHLHQNSLAAAPRSGGCGDI